MKANSMNTDKSRLQATKKILMLMGFAALSTSASIAAPKYLLCNMPELGVWELTLDEQNSTVVLRTSIGLVTKYDASYGSSEVTWRSVGYGVTSLFSLDRQKGVLRRTVVDINSTVTASCTLAAQPKDRLF